MKYGLSRESEMVEPDRQLTCESLLSLPGELSSWVRWPRYRLAFMHKVAQ